MRLIPPPSPAAPTLPASPTLPKALQILQSPGINTGAPKIDSCVKKRIGGYPESGRKGMHRARCRLPLPLAAVLAAEPQLVSAAVEAFYYR